MSGTILIGAPPPSWKRLRDLMQELFASSPGNLAISIAYLGIAGLTLPHIFDWLFVQATISGTQRSACDPAGACWTFVKVYLGQFIYGRYPPDQRWRVDLAMLILSLSIVPFLRAGRRITWRNLVVIVGLAPTIAGLLMAGGLFGLSSVSSDQWGGITLNLVLWFGGAAGSFLLGLLLALGRRSRLPVVRAVSIAHIEFFRGVPLVTVLFAASVMLPILLPAGTDFPKVMRALVALILFHAAQMAEVLRGGLQAIPKGQYEAAGSLGFTYWRSMALIILPQVLRMVVPGIINVLVGLFQGTSLVTIIGLIDALGIAKEASSDPDWLGLSWEGYIFVGAMFFVICAGISHYGHKLEGRAGVRALD